MQLNANLTPLNLPEGETSDSCNDQILIINHNPHRVLENSKSLENINQIPGYITANPHTYHLIKEIRDTLKEKPTKEEEKLWMFLKNKKTGYHIRRQHIIDNYITDFVCLRKKIVIEIDGKIHLKQREHDQQRSLKLNELGYKVIRFTNEEVNEKPELIALKIKEILDNNSNNL
jgi:very-short-patch-repair endonuclease